MSAERRMDDDMIIRPRFPLKEKSSNYAQPSSSSPSSSPTDRRKQKHARAGRENQRHHPQHPHDHSQSPGNYDQYHFKKTPKAQPQPQPYPRSPPPQQSSLGDSSNKRHHAVSSMKKTYDNYVSSPSHSNQYHQHQHHSQSFLSPSSTAQNHDDSVPIPHQHSHIPSPLPTRVSEHGHGNQRTQNDAILHQHAQSYTHTLNDSQATHNTSIRSVGPGAVVLANMTDVHNKAGTHHGRGATDESYNPAAVAVHRKYPFRLQSDIPLEMQEQKHKYELKVSTRVFPCNLCTGTQCLSLLI